MGVAHRGEGGGELGVVQGGPEVADRRGGADVPGRRGGVHGGGSGALQLEPVAVEVEDVEAQLLGAFRHDGVVPERVNDEAALTTAYGCLSRSGRRAKGKKWIG